MNVLYFQIERKIKFSLITGLWPKWSQDLRKRKHKGRVAIVCVRYIMRVAEQSHSETFRDAKV